MKAGIKGAGSRFSYSGSGITVHWIRINSFLVEIGSWDVFWWNWIQVFTGVWDRDLKGKVLILRLLVKKICVVRTPVCALKISEFANLSGSRGRGGAGGGRVQKVCKYKSLGIF